MPYGTLPTQQVFALTLVQIDVSGGFRISSRGWRVFLEISSGGGDNLPGGGEKIAL